MKLTNQSFGANIVVQHADKSPYLFQIDGGKECEPTMVGFMQLIESGYFTAKFVPNWSQANALPTLIITEKEQS